MGVMASVARELIAAGLAGEALVAALERVEDECRPVDEQAERRRARDRIRKQEIRLRNSAESADMVDATPLKEIPPTPPKENNPPSEPNGSDSFSARRVIEREFEEEFWPLWPDKRAKKPARKAFIAARKRECLETILDGVRRYARTKPPDREWMHASTFLNQERWNDEPGPSPPAKSRNEPAHDALFRAIAEQTQAGHGADQWPSGADDGLHDEPRGTPGNRGYDLDLPPQDYRRAG